MPSDRPEDVYHLRNENERLKSSLRRCRSLVDDYRSKLAANANGDYRPPYEVTDRTAGERNSGVPNAG